MRPMRIGTRIGCMGALLAACGGAPEKKATDGPAEARPAGQLLDALEKQRPDGAPRPGDAVITFAVFSPDEPPRDPRQRAVVLHGRVEATFTTPPADLAPAIAQAKADTQLVLTVHPVGPDLPLNIEALTTSGESDAAALRSARTVVFVRYVGPPAPAAGHLRTAAIAAGVIASETQGVVADLGTLKAWAAPAWRQALVPEGWIDDQLDADVSQAEDGTVVFATRGMAKLGLPDLERTGVAPASARDEFQKFLAAWAALRAHGHARAGDRIGEFALHPCQRPAIHFDHECVALTAPP